MSSTPAPAPVDGTVPAFDGLPLACRDYGGGGPGLVLLHGFGGNLEATDEVAGRLRAGRHVVSMDVRGFGRSGDPPRFRMADAVRDVETVAARYGLRDADVVGFSMGGIIAGYHGTSHPGSRVVSVDGFGAGVASLGTAADRAALARYMDWARTSLAAMTAPPEHGDLAWKERQVRAIREALQAMDYDPPHRDRMIDRQFATRHDGTYQRRPSRRILDDTIADAFDRDPPAHILDMYRDCAAPALIIRCTRSEWPAVLDAELDHLTATRPNIRVVRLALTHLGPITVGLDRTVREITNFLSPACRPR
jgi:pimeloyl-ACP methyl ester carboxylesterase